MIDITAHRIARIELASSFVSNNGQRTIRFTNYVGESFEVTVYGQTEALESLPRAEYFSEFKAKRE